ncbi:MAG: PAS domain S-box protein, partial [Verrucomicrobiaceae bacterium]
MSISTNNDAAFPRQSRNVVWYAGLGFGIVLAIGCAVWHQCTRRDSEKAGHEVDRLMQWAEEALEFERDLVSMYGAALQPPGPGWDRPSQSVISAERSANERFTRLSKAVIDANGQSEYSVLVQTLTSIEEPLAQLSQELEGLPPTGRPGPPSREAVRERLNAARNRFDDADRALDSFSGSIQDALRVAKARHLRVKRLHDQSALFLMCLLGSSLGGTSILFYRFRIRAQREARVREELIEQLKGADLKYQSIFDNAVEGIFQTTPDGRFLTANRALARMYGYRSPEHLMGSMFDIGTQLYVEPEQRSALLKTLRGGDVVSNLEIEIVRADGRTIWVRENVRAVRDQRGELLYLEGTVEDVSDRWWNEQRRRLQYATARVLERAASVAEARPMILQTVCEILDWDMGAVWDVNAGETHLECVEVWHAPHIDIAEFEEAVTRAQHEIGEELAGEVWESGEPKWIANLQSRADSMGARIAVKHGMGSAFGVPIKVAGEVRHVAEFFSPKISLPDPELLQTLGLIANQLGHLIER